MLSELSHTKRQHSPPHILSGTTCSHDPQKLSSYPRRWNVKRQGALTLDIDQAWVVWEICALQLVGTHHEYLQKGGRDERSGGGRKESRGQKRRGRKDGERKWGDKQGSCEEWTITKTDEVSKDGQKFPWKKVFHPEPLNLGTSWLFWGRGLGWYYIWGVTCSRADCSWDQDGVD